MLKCLVCLYVVIAVRAASLSKKKDIHVEVLYEHNPARNLDVKTQLSPKDEEFSKFLDGNQESSKKKEGNPNALRNLDAKIQLSPEEASQALKYIPLQESNEISPEKLRIVTPEDANRPEFLEQQQQPLILRPQQQSVDSDDDFAVVVQAEEIVKDGLSKLKSAGLSKKNLEELKKKFDSHFLSLRQQESSNIFQNLIGGVQNITGSFLENLTGSNNSSEQRPGIGQTILNTFQQITGNVTSLGQQVTTSNTILGDPQATSPSGPFQVFQGVANQVSQAINNLNPFNQQTQAPGTEGDSSATPSGPFQNIQNVLGNLNPFNQNANNSSSPANPIQSAANQVGQFINNIIQPSSTQAPASEGDEQSGSSANPIQNVANQIGQAISNLNPFNRRTTTGAPKPAEDKTTAKPAESEEAKPDANKTEDEQRTSSEKPVTEKQENLDKKETMLMTE